MKYKKTISLLLLFIANFGVLKAAAVEFPKSYQEKLSILSKQFPDWVFEPVNIDLDFSECVNNQIGKKSLVRNCSDFLKSKEKEFYLPYKNRYLTFDNGGWVAANKNTVKHYLDPRNFLDEDNIFMFESLEYDPSFHNKQGIEEILSGTFMHDKVIIYKDALGNEITTNKTYSDVILEAGKASKTSPYYLASKIRSEVCYSDGSGSGSTTGAYKNHKGYYNFYNIKANDSADPISLGLEYAKTETKFSAPWDSPEKSIIGGAQWISESYISKGQNTVYFQRFNVLPGSFYPLHTHQYLTNAYGAVSTSQKTSDAYRKMKIIDKPKKFLIPVYKNMPENDSLKKDSEIKEPGKVNYQGTHVYTGPGLNHTKTVISLPIGHSVNILNYCQTDSKVLDDFLKSPYWAKIRFTYKNVLSEGYVPAEFVDKNTKIELKSGTHFNMKQYCECSDDAFFESSNFNIVEINKSGDALTKNTGDATVYIFTNGNLQIVDFSIY